jgi:hypothetical protein
MLQYNLELLLDLAIMKYPVLVHYQIVGTASRFSGQARMGMLCQA